MLCDDSMMDDLLYAARNVPESHLQHPIEEREAIGAASVNDMFAMCFKAMFGDVR